MNNVGAYIFAFVGVLGAFTIGIAAAIILRGWALSLLWGWFVVPIFQLPPITIVQAMGVALVASFLTHQSSHQKPDEKQKWTWAASAFLGPPLCVGLGWVIKSYM